MITTLNADEIALGYFSAGYNCAQSVLLAVAEPLKLDGTDLAAISAPFGDGLAQEGRICGCLIASAMAIGLAVGRSGVRDARSREMSYAAMKTILKWFTERLHATECNELTGIDFADREHLQENLAKVRLEICGPIVSFVTQLAVAQIEVLRQRGGL